MGDKCYFQVESKSFKLVKNAFEVSIIERGRKHLSSASMGFAATYWFRDALVKVANLSND
jgi:NADPH-dependent 7-cyano-7-deazaguanine reductase QueF-like protein